MSFTCLQFVDQAPVLVFGSNLKGIHGAGAALFAKQWYGACQGVGQGLSGRSWALPTKSTPYEALSLAQVQEHCKALLHHARSNPSELFLLTEVGCGLAGFSCSQIAPFFKGSPPNVILPAGFRKILVPGSLRLAVIGSRSFGDYEALSERLDSRPSQIDDPKLVCLAICNRWLEICSF